MSPHLSAPDRRSRRRRTFPALAATAMFATALAVPATAVVTSIGVPGVGAAASDLFISEYIEGSSNNKAIEIYNGTGAAVDLAAGDYALQYFFNGNPVSTLTITLTGTVADGDVHVVAQSSSNATILAQADQTNGSGWFNGDDAIVLAHAGTPIDSLGQAGVDPGTEWGTGLLSTADNTLRRQPAVCAGDPVATDAFDPATASWDGYAVDTFGGLGSHTASCGGGGGDTAPSVAGTVPADGATGVAFTSDVSVTFSEAVDLAPGAASINCTITGAHPASISGGPTTFVINPDVDFGDNEVCTLTLLAAGVTDQDAIDPPDNMAADAAVSFTTLDQVVCGDPATAIHDIQGSGATSPIVGSSVTVEAVVVADLQGPGQFSGYFLQEEDADVDANVLTSEGIFVFDSANPVAVGDVVRLTGNVVEFLSSGQRLTELSGVTGLQLCAPGGSVTATPISLPVADLTVWERTEGMVISLPQQLSVTETFTLGRFGEVSLSVGGRLFTPTAVTTPGAAAIALQDLNNRSRILLDDANNQQNVDPIRYPEPTGLTAFETVREGDTVTGLTGVLDQRFGVYRVQPTGPVSFTESNLRPTSPPVVGGGIQVASMNVLNFFNGDGLGGGFPTSRGANTPAELVRQRDKIVAALIGMDADIVGLMEIENDSGANSALAELVAALNAVAGPGTYAYIDTGVVGGDAIRVALVYQPAKVTPVGAHAVLDSTVDPRFDDTRSRPALAQAFSQNNNGQKLTVVVNHLKSKGSACVGDPDTGDGQGNCNVTRTQAALALADWLATDPTSSGDPDVLIIGDLNSYAQEDPITALKNGGFTDLIADRVGPYAYSYVFGGQSGYLDHALANASLDAQVTGAGEWHINADEPLALDYNVEFKSVGQQSLLYAPTPYRSSDHDPVLVGICQSPTLSVSLDQTVIWIPNHKYRTITATPTSSGDVVSVDLVSAVSNEPDNGIGDGNTVNDVVVVNDTTVKVRAERSALGHGRTYTMTWVATNDCGATATATATVFVPNQWRWIFG